MKKKELLKTEEKIWLACELSFLLFHNLGSFNKTDAIKVSRELVEIIENKLS